MLCTFVGQGDSRDLLARAVRRVWGMDELPEISCLPDGKPFFSHYPNCHFNISHSGGVVLIALADQPVGVDIEMIRPRRENLPAFVFREEAYDRFSELGGDWNAFYTMWTEVESIIKYTGEGLKAWRRAEVPEGCVITNLAGDGWCGAICAHEKLSAELTEI